MNAPWLRLALVVGLLAAWGCQGDDDDKKKKPDKHLDPDAYELNNDFDTCASIIVTPSDFIANDLTLHNQYDEDYFCFSLGENSIVTATITFDNGEGNLDLQLLNSSRFPVDTSASTTQHMELIAATLVAGNYYIRVFSPAQDTNIYSMEITTISAVIPTNPDTFEPNDTSGTCTAVVNPVDLLPYNPPETLSIHTPTDEDWFCFNLSAVADLKARITFFHQVGNLDMDLLDVGLTVILSGISLTDNEEITGVLPAGDYLLRVRGVGGDMGSYTIRISATPGGGLLPDPYEANEDPSSACSGNGYLGTLTGSGIPTWEHAGLTLDTIFDEDYYCFNLATDATVQVDLFFVHRNGNLDLEILDSTPAVIAFSRTFTDDERLLVENLPAGEYTIHADGVGSAATTYDMVINVFEVDAYDQVTPNDDPTSAAFLGTMSTGSPGLTETGLTIHSRTDEDWLSFALAAGTDYDLTIDALFQHWVGDLDMDLYEASDTNQPIQWASTRNDNEQILSNLPPGTYLLRVYGFLGVADNYGINRYDLNLLATPTGSAYLPDRYEINNSFTLATPISLNFTTGANPLNIHNSADRDYFEFGLQGGQDQVVTVDVTHDVITGDLDLALYVDDGSGPRLVIRDDGAVSNSRIEAILPPGGGYTYYICVYGWNGATNVYDLAVTARNATGGYSPDAWEPNNTFAAPNQRFLNFNTGGTVTRTGLTIHNSIDEDYISFSVNTIRSVTIDLTFVVNCDPATGGDEFNCHDLDMWVLDDQQNLVDYDVSGANNARVVMNVAPGIEYRILVYGYRGAMNTYNFSLSHAAPIPLGEDGFEPNDDCLTEARLVPLPVAIPDLTIDNVATADYYKVSLNQPDRLTARITFTNALGDLDLELLDGQCNLLYESKSTVNSVEQIQANLVPGDYIVGVMAGGMSPNSYRLDIFTSSGAGGLGPDAYEYNNDLLSCTPIPFPWDAQQLTIHNPIDEDFYCFSMGTGDVLARLFFVHALGDINGTLWCITGGTTGPSAPPCPRIIGSATSQTDNEIIWDGSGPFHVKAGDYYIQVESAANGTNYYDIEVSNN